MLENRNAWLTPLSILIALSLTTRSDASVTVTQSADGSDQITVPVGTDFVVKVFADSTANGEYLTGANESAVTEGDNDAGLEAVGATFDSASGEPLNTDPAILDNSFVTTSVGTTIFYENLSTGGNELSTNDANYFINTNGLTVVAIPAPEPASCVVLSFASVGLLKRRQRV